MSAKKHLKPKRPLETLPEIIEQIEFGLAYAKRMKDRRNFDFLVFADRVLATREKRPDQGEALSPFLTAISTWKLTRRIERDFDRLLETMPPPPPGLRPLSLEELGIPPNIIQAMKSMRSAMRARYGVGAVPRARLGGSVYRRLTNKVPSDRK